MKIRFLITLIFTIIFNLALMSQNPENKSAEIVCHIDQTSRCRPYSVEYLDENQYPEPSKDGAVEIVYEGDRLTFNLIQFRYPCDCFEFSSKMVVVGDTLNVFTGLRNHNNQEFSTCTCEHDFEMNFNSFPQGHYIIKMIGDDGETIYASCDTTLIDGFKHVIYDNRKPMPENYRPGTNFEISRCMALPENLPPDASRDENLPPDEEIGSVLLSYARDTLSVELRAWQTYCQGYVPYAVIEDGCINISMFLSAYVSCVCCQTVSFDFSGIEPGEYKVNLLHKEIHDTEYRAFDVDLQDGYSHLFLKNTSDLTSVNNFDDSSIEFDGTLVEFSSDGSATVELFTAEGVRLARAEGSGAVRLSTGELMPGIYVVRATTADGRTVRRKIVVK